MRRAIVIDASVAVKWIIDEPDSAEARSLLVPVKNRETTILVAPALLPVEVHYAVAKRYRRSQASQAQLEGALPALVRIFSLLAPLVYDCIYIALAVESHAALATADRAQAAVAQKANVPVLMIALASERRG